MVRNFAGEGFLLFLVVEGEGFARLDETTINVTSGDLVLLDGSNKPTFGTQSNMEYYSLFYEGMRAKDISLSRWARVVHVDKKQILPHFLSLLSPFHKGGQPDNTLISSQLTALLECFALSEEKMKFQPAYDYICTHLDQKITIGQLAKLTGLSSYYFIRAFNEECGMTPHEYILKLRVYTANHLLKTSSMTLGEITRTCGFSNESAFNNTFKRVKGITPMAYRKQARLLF